MLSQLTINHFLLLFLQFFHVCIVFVVIFFPIIFRNILLLCFILIMNIFIVTQWHLHGYCFITDLENYLRPKSEEIDVSLNKDNNSFITIFFQQYFTMIDEKTVTNIICTIPFISTTICCIKIYQNYYSLLANMENK